MGAAATKQLQPDKTKHATLVLEAVKAYEEEHPEEKHRDAFQLPVFKRHVLLAAAYSKKMGRNVDNSIAQLSDQDLEMLWGYIQKQRDQERKADVMTVEEFVEEDVNDRNNDNIDETTSVLSYGDDEVGGDGESDIEMMESSGSLRLKEPNGGRPSEDLEDLEETHDDIDDHRSKVFPSEVQMEIKPPYEADRGNLKISKQQQEIGIAEALAKFWEIDELGSITSQLSLEKDGPFSPIAKSPKKTPRKSEGKNTYKDRGQRIDERNETLLGLQRQKVISFTQNAQLEREVEALQKQLERIEQLECRLTSPSSRTGLNYTLQSSSSTVAEALSRKKSDSPAFADNNLPQARFPYIYPIDEEATEWTGAAHQSSSQSKQRRFHQQQGPSLRQHQPPSKNQGRRLASSSSEDENQIDNRFVPSGVESRETEQKHLNPVIRTANKVPENQLSQIKSIRQHPSVRRRIRSGADPAADSDDSSSQVAPEGKNRLASDNATNGHFRKNVSPSDPTRGTGSNNAFGKKAEKRRIRNTIGNIEEAKSPHIREVASEDEVSVYAGEGGRRGEFLKQLNRRRLSLDGEPRGQPASSENESMLKLDHDGIRGTESEAPQLFEEKREESEAEVVVPTEKKRAKPLRRRRKKEDKKIHEELKNDPEDNSAWNSDLDSRWGEVSLLLRKSIKTEEDMLYCVAATEAGIIFTDQMNSIAKSLNVLRGSLSRWLLPFDNNTRIETQCSTPHSVVENMPNEFRGKLTERQVHYLVAGANGVRKLVRIKIADDNDLEQARKALQTIDLFFKLLYEQANRHHTPPFQLLSQYGRL